MSDAKDKLVLAMDQGTTSSRAILFDSNYAIVEQAQYEFEQHFPNSGWVEHSAMRYLANQSRYRQTGHRQSRRKPSRLPVSALPTSEKLSLIWDRQRGEPIHNAIVWQDRRTADLCNKLKAEGLSPWSAARPVCCSTPISPRQKSPGYWTTLHGARDRAERGELAFGTMDSWLLWNLTAGKSHATDATNASRTMLYNIHSGEWDEELLSLVQYSRITPSRG